mmetsp:Transcript_65473/g.156587  ORF Transcript_65473/g.156587 Transcript_65473/m.156587 type:complete len:286 (+) Transcript_65473:257-1114(+)
MCTLLSVSSHEFNDEPGPTCWLSNPSLHVASLLDAPGSTSIGRSTAGTEASRLLEQLLEHGLARASRRRLCRCLGLCFGPTTSARKHCLRQTAGLDNSKCICYQRKKLLRLPRPNWGGILGNFGVAGSWCWRGNRARALIEIHILCLLLPTGFHQLGINGILNCLLCLLEAARAWRRLLSLCKWSCRWRLLMAADSGLLLLPTCGGMQHRLDVASSEVGFLLQRLCCKLSLVYNGIIQKSLLYLLVPDVHLHRVRREEAIDMYFSHLTNTMCSVRGLPVHCWIPI